MLAMLRRHEVEILLKAGHSKTEVARLSGVSLRSVKRIAEERPVEHVEDARERAKRQSGRPSTVADFRKQVVEIVRETPDLASLEILRRVKESGYSGGKTARWAGLNPTIAELTQAIEPEAEKCPPARRLMTHPGVGALTALAFVLILGKAERFQCGK
jgi:transposase